MPAGNVMNYLPMNIDISKTVPGVAAINAVTSPPSDSSDSCSETDDEQKPVLSDKMNSQVTVCFDMLGSAFITSCLVWFSPVRFSLG